jgi:hypothetical protein
LYDSRAQKVQLTKDGITITVVGKWDISVSGDASINVGGNLIADVEGTANLNVDGAVTAAAASWAFTGATTFNDVVNFANGWSFTGGTATGTLTNVNIAATGGSFTWNGHRIDDSHRHPTSGGGGNTGTVL